MGIDQTRIDMKLAALDQSSLQALFQHPDKERLKDFLAPALARLAKHAVVGDRIIQAVP